MKTVFHTTIDGHEVVTALGDPPIAPVETYAVIGPVLAQSPEYAAMQAKIQEIAAARRVKDEALAVVYRCAPAQRQQAERAYTDLVMALAMLEAGVVPLVAAFDALKSRLVEERAVYHRPKPGEDLVEDSTAADLQAKHDAQPPHTLLCLDGTYVADYRGVVHWQRTAGGWAQGHITSLGLEPPVGAILGEELAPEQRQEIQAQQEAARVQALTHEQRQAERDQALQAAVQRAAAMRSEMEIAGDVEALAKSQAWYQVEAAEIADKYGVT